MTKELLRGFPILTGLFADVNDKELDRQLDIMIDVKEMEEE